MARSSASILIASFQENYEQLLRFLTRKMNGDSERAADVVQDTYVRLAGTSELDETIDNPRAYIYRVAGNLAIDRIRRERRMSAHVETDQAQSEIHDPQPGPEKIFLSREQINILDHALSKLPEKPRRALLLFRVDGLSHSEIADRLGVSNSMVAKYIARALKHCRDALLAEGRK
ncbi:MAG: sigma-70 family RNA polymerase sigma factor [Thalassospira sp.]|uniref:RNA polymerase sigma factor n=1 Tax=Thalassospira sp. TaxID=1912094 RepID=UPI001B0DB80C|nr:sigma-70 family RNA polymerase sigma factor [Thalassospira sp.]MBO6803706.1 sigma-70 family RNA polymerase sigma factor [Thalassospira sp.]MBO6816950.1 sigma-70 family RNA polymerase sigma factor [Thalassospira sp.]MBO6886934.1 sigma-70 family RNA polymerase sigma factor [Thalassospira sp.]